MRRPHYESLRIFIGFDSKEPEAYHVLSHSIITRASCPVSITPLVQAQLRTSGAYTRERGATESTEFSMTRFLVPYLCGYAGKAVFMDCDMLCLSDIAGLWDEIERQMDWNPVSRPKADKALLVCQHDYTPREATKFLGQVQTVYPRKNWSSLMVFNNPRCRALSPEYVNSASGLELHRFQWLKDEQIGSLPIEWNWLVGDYERNDDARILHYTLGGPWFDASRDCDHAELWHDERDRMRGLTPVAAA
jgi:hypothetical protein